MNPHSPRRVIRPAPPRRFARVAALVGLVGGSLTAAGAVPGSAQSADYQLDYQAVLSGGGPATSASYGLAGSGGEISGATASLGGHYGNRPGYVGELNDPPLLIGLTLDRVAGGGVKFVAAKLVALASDLESDPFSLIAVGPLSANGASVMQDGPWIFYSPPAGFNGTDSFPYTVGDALGGEAAATVTIIVLPADNGPTKNIVSISTLGDGSVQVVFNGIPNRTYTVQAATTLVSPAWTTLGSVVASDSGAFAFTDSDAVHFPVRYYRAIAP